jgi:hypothetical protein
VAALLSNPTIEAAAEAAGIHRRTAHRYLDEPNVRQVLGRELDDLMGQATRLTVRAMTSALATLQRIHTDPEAPTSSRVSAARAILDAGPKLREALDLADRVALLEENLLGGKAK